jgi:WD40 repeat protein
LVLVAQALELAEQAEAADLADACRWNLAVWAAETHRLSQMLDHTAAVLCLAISPDGRIAATGLEDGSVHLWDLTTGLPTEPTVRHGAAVQTVAFHPTKPILLSGGKDCGIQLWDLRTGQAATPRLTMPTTAKPGDWRGRYGVTCAAFSRDGRLFAAACDTYIRVWDAVADPPAEIARPTWQPLTDRADTFALAFRDEGTLIFAGAHYGYAVCNARTGALVDNRQRFLAGSWGAFALAVSPNGREILAGCEYRIGAVRLGLGDGEPQGPRLPAHGEVKAVDYHPSGDRVAIGDETGTAWLYDAATARPLGPAFRHPAAVSAVRFTADGTRMLTAAGPVVRVWELAPGLLRHTLVHPPNSSVTSAAFAPDGRTILTGCRGLPSEVIQWDLATGRPTAARIPVDRKEGWVMGVGYGPDAARVYAAVSHDGRVKWWGSADGRPLGQTKRHGNNLWRMALSPDGRRVVAATGEQWGDDQTTAALWDAETGLPICPPLTHMAPVTGFAFSPDGRLLLTAAGSDTRLWDADTGAPLADPHEHSTIIRSVGYAPNGDEVVAGGADGAIRRFDPRTWDQRGRTVHHRGQVNAAGYAAHGRLLFTASNDNTARLWHPASGVAVGPPFQHALSVETAVGSADGVHLITGSTDGIAKVWVIPTGPAAGTVAELRAAVRRMTGLELDEQGAFRQLPSTEWAAYPVAADARDVSMRFLSNTVVGPAIAMGP